MKSAIRILVLTSVLTAGALQAQAPQVQFASLDVYLDSGATPLAAWQFELTDSAGAMRVVGVENGDSAAFPEAPYFDREAVNGGRADRIIVADFSMSAAAALPTGRTRVATVHVELQGPARPDYRLRLIAAGDPQGGPIPARIELNPEAVN